MEMVVPFKEQLLQASYEAVMAMFLEAKAPAFQEVYGEFRGHRLACKNMAYQLASVAATRNFFSGVWCGKGYKPLSEHSGEGYNWFISPLGQRELMRFSTRMANSRLDGKPVLLMDYTTEKNILGLLGSQDEVRQLADGSLLVIAFMDFIGNPLTSALPFLLEGPIQNYRD